MENILHSRSSNLEALTQGPRLDGDHLDNVDQDAIHDLIRGLSPPEASRTLMFNIACWNARLRIINKYKLVRFHGSVEARIDFSTDGSAYDHCRQLIMLGMRRLGRIHRTNNIPIADTGFWACIDECWRPMFFSSYEFKRRIQVEHLSFAAFNDHVQKLNNVIYQGFSLLPGRRGFATDDYGIDILARTWYLFKDRKFIASYERLARSELINVYQTIFGELRDLKGARRIIQVHDSYAERYQEQR